MTEDINFYDPELRILKDGKIPVDTRLAANSLKNKMESAYNERKKWLEGLDKSKALEQRISETEGELTEINEEDENFEEEVLEKTTVIARLEKMLRVESGEEIPTNFVANRAIKLKEEWLKNGVINTKGCSTFKPKITDDAKEYINYIREKDKNADANDISLAGEIENSNIDEDVTIDNDIQKVYENIEEANNLVNNAENSIEEKNDDIGVGYVDQEYVPMTEEEVAKSREKIENDRYNEINFNSTSFDKTFEQEREEIVVAPDREEIDEFTMVKEPEEVEKVVAIEEKIEPKSVVVSSELKEKLQNLTFEELQAMLNEKSERNKELERESSSVKRNVEEEKKINAEVTEEEENTVKEEAKTNEEEVEAEKQREELKAKEEKEAQELKELMIQNIIDMDNKNDSLTSVIENDKEELDNVTKDTETRRENISNIKMNIETKRQNIDSIRKNNEEIQENIKKSQEMKLMFADSELVIEEEKQKVM